MKLLLCLTLAAFVAVAHAQFMQYGPWSACDSTTCTQTRSVTGCGGNPLVCAAFGGVNSPLGLLTCQSCITTGCPDLPTNWQGVYSVRGGRCNPGPASPATAACCCLPSDANVFVRQYDELIEMTFAEGVTMSGNGCNVPASAGTSIPEIARFFPKGLSFKVIDPRTRVNGVLVNAGTYVNNATAKFTVGPTTFEVLNSNVPTVGSAGTATLFGRTFRAILACGNIYIFGLNGFSATDNPICVQELNKVSELASY